MTVQWLPPSSAHFARKVKAAEKIIPSEEVLNGCIAGLTKQAKKESDPERKWRLKEIRKEVQRLRRQLS